ncbi:hypothetical protein C0J52_23347 [Blattella germanica]|nr:hypothetical protein C0J52_23347 [Blattella germanica]
MSSTICFHVVIDNRIRPVKIILFQSGSSQAEMDAPILAYLWLQGTTGKSAKGTKSKKENCYAKWRQKSNRGRHLKPQRTLNACIAKGFTPRRTKFGCRVSMGT